MLKIKDYIFGFIGLIICIIGFLFASYMDSTREIKASVYSIDNNIVTFEDYAGDLWEYEIQEKEPKYTKGENVKIVLNMQGTTHTWYDDTIVKIKREEKTK